MNRESRIVTFYSYKGGTGRSMALANFAWILAAGGKRVLAIDWDLEAPGLHRYFRPFLIDPNLFETEGLIDAFWGFASSAVVSQSSKEPIPDATIAERLEDSTRRLNYTFGGGSIDFIGAGRQGATYSERVNTFDWKRFYDLGGAQILGSAKAYFAQKYEWVLIDSRTGVSDTSGICTMQMPDTVVACFTLNRQSIEGVAAILHSISAYRSPSVNGAQIAFYPLATRIENAEQLKLEIARGYARDLLNGFLPADYQSRRRDYWDTMELAYRPSYAFEEILAAFGDASDAKGSSDTMLAQVEAMARRVTGNPQLSMSEVPDQKRTEVLAKYALGTPAPPAERAPVVPDSDARFLDEIHAKEAIWRNSGFRYRYLLSQRELGLITDGDRKSFGRNMGFYYDNSQLLQPLYRRIDRTFVLGWLVAAVAAGITLMYFATQAVSQGASPSTQLPHYQYALYAGLVVALLAVLTNALLNRRHAPYGVTTAHIIFMAASGPFRGNVVLDYQQAEAEASATPPLERARRPAP